MFSLVKDRNAAGAELRATVVSTLIELMDDSNKIVALEADLGGASQFSKIGTAHPNQFVECGISEANMIGVAAGLSSDGFIPFCHTFAPFATRRVFDQTFLSGGYAHNTINIWGSDPGFTVAHNGGTHTSYEDVALMRTIPGAVVCDACDATQMQWIVKEFCSLEGVHYVRGNRKAVRPVYTPDSTFELGKGNVLCQGRDVLIISAGQLVSDALDAAEELQGLGISCEVVDMFCIKPLDTQLVLSEARDKKLVVCFENHGVIGGLGDAVAAVMAQHALGIPLVRHGVEERFGQVGSAQFLQEEYHLTSQDLVARVKEALQ